MLQAKVTHHLVDERICGSIQPPQMVGRGSVCYSGSALQNSLTARDLLGMQRVSLEDVLTATLNLCLRVYIFTE